MEISQTPALPCMSSSQLKQDAGAGSCKAGKWGLFFATANATAPFVVIKPQTMDRFINSKTEAGLAAFLNSVLHTVVMLCLQGESDKVTVM